MPSFQQLFTASRGLPIRYQGKILVMMDRLEIVDGSAFKLTFERHNSEWRQGVKFRAMAEFCIDNGVCTTKDVVLWQDTAPAVQSFCLRNVKEGTLKLWNVWDQGDEFTQAWMNGAAMIVEELENGRRYFCNDGHPDDNFDDIVFRLERLER